jgi:cellulose synthase/poly-beta-1,6-N-acetylglucosamine synthase-like glycosyltransferase
LCFIDADTFLEPNALSAALAAATGTGADLYSMMTEQITGTFWEKAVLPLVFTALSVGFSPRKINDPRRRDAIANGQFILIKRSVYDAIGGHEAVKNQIVEDKALAVLVKGNGYRLVMANGYAMAKTRMYTSLPGMWEGWTKNIYLGLQDHPAMLLLGVFGACLALMATLFMPLWPLLGLVWYLQGGGLQAGVLLLEALLVWGVLLYARARVARAMHISGWYALTTPLGAGVFAAMMFASAWKVLSGRGVTWKGRKYDPKVVK